MSLVVFYHSHYQQLLCPYLYPHLLQLQHQRLSNAKLSKSPIRPLPEVSLILFIIDFGPSSFNVPSSFKSAYGNYWMYSAFYQSQFMWSNFSRWFFPSLKERRKLQAISNLNSKSLKKMDCYLVITWTTIKEGLKLPRPTKVSAKILQDQAIIFEDYFHDDF